MKKLQKQILLSKAIKEGFAHKMKPVRVVDPEKIIKLRTFKKEVQCILKTNAQIWALGPSTLAEKQKYACKLLGHSKIIYILKGKVYCARCKENIGDTYLGYNTNSHLILEYNTKLTPANKVSYYKVLRWQDRYLIPFPFKHEKRITIKKKKS